LFEADVGSPTVVFEPLVDGVLWFSQIGEGERGTLFILLRPEGFVIQQGGFIHEDGFQPRRVRARPVENGEPMRVDVAPIHHAPVAQPRSAGEGFEGVAGPKDDHAFRDQRERQRIDFVFGDEHGAHGQGEVGVGVEADLRLDYREVARSRRSA